MGGFSAFRNGVAAPFWQRFGAAVTVAFEDDPIGPMAESVEGGGAEHFVGWEGVAPFTEVEIAGQDRSGAFVAFGDQIMEGLVLRRTQRLEAEVVDDEEGQVDQGLEAALEAAGGLGLAQAGEQLSLGGEQHVVADAGDGMADGLGEMALAGAARDRDILPAISRKKRSFITATIPKPDLRSGS